MFFIVNKMKVKTCKQPLLVTNDFVAHQVTLNRVSAVITAYHLGISVWWGPQGADDSRLLSSCAGYSFTVENRTLHGTTCALGSGTLVRADDQYGRS